MHKLVKKLMELKGEIVNRINIIDTETTRLAEERYELSEAIK